MNIVMWAFIFFICFASRLIASTIDCIFRKNNRILLNDNSSTLNRVVGFNSIKLIPILLFELISAIVLLKQSWVFILIAFLVGVQFVMVAVDTKKQILDRSPMYPIYFLMLFIQTSLVAWVFL